MSPTSSGVLYSRTARTEEKTISNVDAVEDQDACRPTKKGRNQEHRSAEKGMANGNSPAESEPFSTGSIGHTSTWTRTVRVL